MDKEELGRAMFEMNVMENKLKQLDQQLGLLEQHISEDQRVESSIGEFGRNARSEVVLPLGGGVFARGGMDKVEKVLVGVGANVLVEKDVDDAKKFVSKRRQKMMDAREDLANQVKNIVQAMAQLERALREGPQSDDHSGHSHPHTH